MRRGGMPLIRYVRRRYDSVMVGGIVAHGIAVLSFRPVLYFDAEGDLAMVGRWM